MLDLTDEEIVGAVTWELARDGRINLADVVHVSAENGVVLLTGTVWSAGQKQAAEEATRRVHGIAGIQNDLTVAMEGEISDAELRAAILDALARQPELAPRVGCSVGDGVVTLVGHIRDAAEEQQAIRIAGSVRGVEQVVSALEIAEIVPGEGALPVDDATLVGKVADALDKLGFDVADRVIRVDQGVATLTGRVTTARERQCAAEAAASVPGVRALRDRLTERSSSGRARRARQGEK